MKIGLLECDHVAPQFRDIAGDYLDMFAALFPGDDLTPYDVCGGRFPKSAEACDAFLCTGSRHSVYDDVPWIHGLADFVRLLHRRERCFVGVCFGHQMLGHALGGRVAKAAAGWCVGVHTFDVAVPQPWMTPPAAAYNLMMMCQDQIVDLPPGATVLAATAKCPVGMIRVGASLLGLQAHPEFPVSYERALMASRIARISADTVRAGLESLDRPVDAALAAGWMRAFMEGRNR